MVGTVVLPDSNRVIQHCLLRALPGGPRPTTIHPFSPLGLELGRQAGLVELKPTDGFLAPSDTVS